MKHKNKFLIIRKCLFILNFTNCINLVGFHDNFGRFVLCLVLLSEVCNSVLFGSSSGDFEESKGHVIDSDSDSVKSAKEGIFSSTSFVVSPVRSHVEAKDDWRNSVTAASAFVFCDSVRKTSLTLENSEREFSSSSV